MLQLNAFGRNVIAQEPSYGQCLIASKGSFSMSDMCLTTFKLFLTHPYSAVHQRWVKHVHLTPQHIRGIKDLHRNKGRQKYEG